MSARSMATSEPPSLKGLASVSVCRKFRKGSGTVTFWNGSTRGGFAVGVLARNRAGPNEVNSSVAWANVSSGGNACFQFNATAFDAHTIFDFVTALVLELFGLAANKALECQQGRCLGRLAGLGARLDQLLVELHDLPLLMFWIGEGHRDGDSSCEGLACAD